MGNENKLTISKMKYFILSQVGSEYSSGGKKVRVIDIVNWNEDYLKNTNVEVTSKYGGSISIELVFLDGNFSFCVDFSNVNAKPQELTFIFNSTQKIKISSFSQQQDLGYNYDEVRAIGKLAPMKPFFIPRYTLNNVDAFKDLTYHFSSPNTKDCKCIFEVGYLKTVEANISINTIKEIGEVLNVRFNDDYDFIESVFKKYKQKEVINKQTSNKPQKRFASAGTGCLGSTFFILATVIVLVFIAVQIV